MWKYFDKPKIEKMLMDWAKNYWYFIQAGKQEGYVFGSLLSFASKLFIYGFHQCIYLRYLLR